MNKLVVNVFGAPSAGKTVAASSLFAKLKKHHVDALLVGEFARDMIVENNKLALDNELIIWATQQYRIFCSYEHAQLTITDSPILLGSLYQTKAPSAIMEVILDCHKRFNNFNILLELDTTRPYSMVGRIHDKTESLAIEQRLKDMFDVYQIPYVKYADYSEDDLVDLILAAME